jgi:hypothetical protein
VRSERQKVLSLLASTKIQILTAQSAKRH